MSHTGLMGREALLSQILSATDKGKHILLTGPCGSGKSAILHHIAALYDEKRACIVVMDHQIKGQLVELVCALLRLNLLRPEDILLKSAPTQMCSDLQHIHLQRQVQRINQRELTDIIKHTLAVHQPHAGRMLIAVDDLSFLTPTQLPYWCDVAESAQIIATARICRTSLQKLWWKMQRFQVEPLTLRDARKLVTHYLAENPLHAESPQQLLHHIVGKAQGNPLAMADMLEACTCEPLIKRKHVRELNHGSGRQFRDATPLVLLTGASLLVSRVIALGLGDRTLYILSGLGIVMSLFMRQLWARHHRRRD